MNNDCPMVSICIPAYNQPELLNRLLESILVQSFDDYEIIVTDDSSNDSVEKVIQQYKDIHYHRNNPSLGSSANYNKALSYAKGTYIKVMAHDDWFTTKDSLERYVYMLRENPHAELAFSGTIEDMGNKETYTRYTRRHEAKLLKKDYMKLLEGVPIGSPSATIWVNHGIVFDETLAWLSDIDIYIRIFKKNPNFIFTQDPLVTIGYDGGTERLTNQGRNDLRLQRDEGNYLAQKYKIAEKKYFIRLYRKTKATRKEKENININFIEDYYLKFVDDLYHFIWKIIYFVGRRLHCD